jgi:octaprenyl-diphosphate synthase
MTVSTHVEDRENLRQFGENLGIAFQIKDDILDFQGDQILLGKPVGADLKEKKITLPLILSFKNSPEKEKKFILKLIKKGVTEKDITQIYIFIEKYGGLQSARDYALSFAEKAKQTLDSVNEGPAKENALHFVDYVINRKK